MEQWLGTTPIRPPDISSASVPTYANVTHVSHTPFDVRLTFSLIATPHEEQPAPSVALTPVAVAEVIMPPSAAEALVELLRTELGELNDQPGRQHATDARR